MFITDKASTKIQQTFLFKGEKHCSHFSLKCAEFNFLKLHHQLLNPTKSRYRHSLDFRKLWCCDNWIVLLQQFASLAFVVKCAAVSFGVTVSDTEVFTASKQNRQSQLQQSRHIYILYCLVYKPRNLYPNYTKVYC